MPIKKQPRQELPKGTEIPGPKRAEFLRDLKKVAKVDGSGDNVDRPQK